MGILVKYTCKKCGYVADDIAIGPSAFQNIMQAVVKCTKCNNIMSRPVDADWVVVEKYRKCSFCDCKEFVKWDGHCPQCGSIEISGEDVGWWD